MNVFYLVSSFVGLFVDFFVDRKFDLDFGFKDQMKDI